MTTLRSGTQVSSGNRPAARRHPPRTPLNPDAARNVRYLRDARAYQRATGDSPGTLRQKRRWLNNEHQAGRISGKACRELIDFYSKKNIGKPKSKLPKVRSLTSDAKSVKRRLDESFIERPDGNPSAVAMDENHGNTSGDAGEGPSGATNRTQDSDGNSHQALGESGNGRDLNEPPHEGAVDIVAGAHIKLEDNTEAEDDTEMETEVETETEMETEVETETETETEDESSSDGEELSNRTSQAAVAPVNTADANDAAARQRILELGLELADQSSAGQEAQMRIGYGDEVEIKMEEQESE